MERFGLIKEEERRIDEDMEVIRMGQPWHGKETKEKKWNEKDEKMKFNIFYTKSTQVNGVKSPPSIPSMI